MTAAELLTQHTCDIVEDLLPFYAEGTIEKDAAAFVRTHLSQCRKCQNLFDLIQEDFSEIPDTPTAPPDFNFRRKYRTHLIVSGICTAFVMIAILIPVFL